jgi:hypothetical protein
LRLKKPSTAAVRHEEMPRTQNALPFSRGLLTVASLTPRIFVPYA